jgi:transcriptional regulator with XRE-family HTH domain
MKLRRLREERSMTQEGLAKRARLSRMTVARIEARTKRTIHQRPSLRTLEKLAKALDVSVGELLG